MSEVEKRLKEYSIKKEVQEIEKRLREDANKKLCLIDTMSNFPKLSLSLLRRSNNINRKKIL